MPGELDYGTKRGRRIYGAVALGLLVLVTLGYCNDVVWRLDRLAARLDDPDPGVRKAAVEELARNQGSAAIEHLIEAVANDDPQVVHIANQALRAHPALWQLVVPELLEQACRQPRCFDLCFNLVQWILIEHDPPDGLSAWLLDDLQARDTSRQLRGLVLAAAMGWYRLDESQAERARATARETITAADPHLRLAAGHVARELGKKVGEHEVTIVDEVLHTRLLELARDPDPQVRRFGILTATRVPGDATIPAVIDGLVDESERVRLCVALDLHFRWRLERPTEGEMALIPELMRAIEANDDDGFRFSAFLALSAFEERAAKAMPLAIRALANGDQPRAAHMAASLLGGIGPAAHGAVPALRKALQQADDDIAGGAAGALARLGDIESIPTIVERVNALDACRGAHSFIYALNGFGPAARGAAPELARWLDQDRWHESNAIFEALARILTEPSDQDRALLLELHEPLQSAKRSYLRSGSVSVDVGAACLRARIACALPDATLVPDLAHELCRLLTNESWNPLPIEMLTGLVETFPELVYTDALSDIDQRVRQSLAERPPWQVRPKFDRELRELEAALERARSRR